MNFFGPLAQRGVRTQRKSLKRRAQSPTLYQHKKQLKREVKITRMPAIATLQQSKPVQYTRKYFTCRTTRNRSHYTREIAASNGVPLQPTRPYKKMDEL